MCVALPCTPLPLLPRLGSARTPAMLKHEGAMEHRITVLSWVCIFFSASNILGLARWCPTLSGVLGRVGL